jgi:hypothetical protein
MVATASKLISCLMFGFLVMIFLIPQAFLHKTEANLGLMTLRSVVSQSFSSGKALVLSNEFAGFRNFWNRSQGSFLSYSRRFLVIPKAQLFISNTFETLSPSPRTLEAKTIDFRGQNHRLWFYGSSISTTWLQYQLFGPRFRWFHHR